MERQKEKVGTLNGKGGMAEGLVAGTTCMPKEVGKIGLELKYWEEQ